VVFENDVMYDHPNDFYREIDRIILTNLGVPKQEIERTIDYINEVLLKDEFVDVKPYPELIEFLEWCKSKGIKLHVMSGSYVQVKGKIRFENFEEKNETAFKNKQVGMLGLTKYFESVKSTLYYGGIKPDTIVFENFLKRHGLKGEECVHIGDKWVDMEAKKTGMRTILINPDNKPYPKNKEEPDFVAKNYEEVLERVKRLTRQ
jgi:FMN phosphatase YigB (HAD superfamily)